MSPLNITQPLGIWSINVYNGYYKVMSNIPKMGHLPTPVFEKGEPVFLGEAPYQTLGRIQKMNLNDEQMMNEIPLFYDDYPLVIERSY